MHGAVRANREFLCDRFNRSFKIAIDEEIFIAVDLADKLDRFTDGGAPNGRVGLSLRHENVRHERSVLSIFQGTCR